MKLSSFLGRVSKLSNARPGVTLALYFVWTLAITNIASASQSNSWESVMISHATFRDVGVSDFFAKLEKEARSHLGRNKHFSIRAYVDKSRRVSVEIPTMPLAALLDVVCSAHYMVWIGTPDGPLIFDLEYGGGTDCIIFEGTATEATSSKPLPSLNVFLVFYGEKRPGQTVIDKDGHYISVFSIQSDPKYLVSDGFHLRLQDFSYFSEIRGLIASSEGHEENRFELAPESLGRTNRLDILLRATGKPDKQ